MSSNTTLNLDILKELFMAYCGDEVERVEWLPQAASKRQYVRLIGENHTYLGGFNPDQIENDIFFQFSDFFNNNDIKAPQVYSKHPDRMHYLLQDLGNTTLMDMLKQHRQQQNRFPFDAILFYRQAIDTLLAMQLVGANAWQDLSFAEVPRFDRTAMLWDMNYCKYYFFRPAGVVFDERDLEADFQRLADFLLRAESVYFMHRDFQARNIMLYQNDTYVIDYQGGRLGPLQYDLASLLWQAQAQIPFPLREELLNYYEQLLEKRLPHLSLSMFRQLYYGYVLLRLLQVLGAYGYRGWFEGKPYFINSIPHALQNVAWWLDNVSLPVSLPSLRKALSDLSQSAWAQVQMPVAADASLTIYLQSFSFRKGYPTDHTEHGGGFVFDCRSIHNPGRYEPYKYLTGLDLPVIRFLQTQSHADDFLRHCFAIIKPAILDYLQRGFAHLTISYGCTGGQHRSVYCTEQTAQYLREQFSGLRIELRHLGQSQWLKEPTP